MLTRSCQGNTQVPFSHPNDSQLCVHAQRLMYLPFPQCMAVRPRLMRLCRKLYPGSQGGHFVKYAIKLHLIQPKVNDPQNRSSHCRSLDLEDHAKFLFINGPDAKRGRGRYFF